MESSDEEHNWQYYLSERRDWVRFDGQDIEIKMSNVEDKWLSLDNLKLQFGCVLYTNDSNSFQIFIRSDDNSQIIFGHDKVKLHSLQYLLNIDLYNLRSLEELQRSVEKGMEAYDHQYDSANPQKNRLLNRRKGLIRNFDNSSEIARLQALNLKEQIIDADVDPSENEEWKAEAYHGLARVIQNDTDPVDELIKILKDRANTIGKWYYWNGNLKADFLLKCYCMIRDAQAENELLTLEEALAVEVKPASVIGQRFSTRSNQQPLTAMNAMNWHRHPSVFHKEKPHTKTHDSAADVCRFSLQESLGL